MSKIILGVSSSFCANFLRGQVAYLVGHGFDVTIISGPGEEISLLSRKENARLYTIPFTKRITPVTDLFQLFKIIRILKKEKPEIINAGNPKSGFLIMLACWLTGYKGRIFTLHGLLSDSKTGFFKWLITLTEKISCGIAKQVIAVSPTLKTHAENRGILSPDKSLVIGQGSANGIDLLSFRRSTETEIKAQALKKQIGLNENEIVLGFVGRISRDKGVGLLFEAFNRLINKYPSLRLILAGPLIEENPVTKQELRQLYNDKNIIYLGKLFDVIPIYSLTDILVLPSYREGFPNVLIEAAAMEVPVIASDIPGCRDAVSPGTNGLLFASGDALALSQSIEKLLQQKDLREQYGRNGRKFVEENFENRLIWQGQVNLYRSLLEDTQTDRLT
ncbi:MAG: glycosyltransferase family 4 protein [Chitinophagaceae bacterium]|nr:glycosyltransferase family 4 protein [Chitinophagaceae bacterium]